jgi:hypothetical protein
VLNNPLLLPEHLPHQPSRPPSLLLRAVAMTTAASISLISPHKLDEVAQEVLLQALVLVLAQQVLRVDLATSTSCAETLNSSSSAKSFSSSLRCWSLFSSNSVLATLSLPSSSPHILTNFLTCSARMPTTTLPCLREPRPSV